MTDPYTALREAIDADELAAHQSIGAVAFLSAVQGDGDWADEFLAWYKPAEWLGEQRACAAFLAAKVADLIADRDELRAALSDAADDIADWGAYASAYAKTSYGLAGCVAKYRALARGKEPTA